MQDVDVATFSPRDALDDARHRIAAARVAINTVTGAQRHVAPALLAMAYGLGSLLGVVRVGLSRPDIADTALKDVLAAATAHDSAWRRSRWKRREFAEDLRSGLLHLVSASDLIAAVLQEQQVDASQQESDALKQARFLLAVARETLDHPRPGMSTDDTLESVALNLRLVIDTSQTLWHESEAVLSRRQQNVRMSRSTPGGEPLVTGGIG